MTTTFLNTPQQVALQQALISSKLINACTIKSDITPSMEQQVYGQVAVSLYRYTLGKIKWSSFLKTAINTATGKCQWLASELIRCQHHYEVKPNDVVISEQSAFFTGVFSEEFAYIDMLRGIDQPAG